MADLPHHNLGVTWLPKSSGTCPMGLCNPTGALGNAALGYSSKIWTENLHLGLFSVGPSLPPQPSLCHRAHKKSSGPSAPGAREHNLPPAPSQEEQKAFFPPACSCWTHQREGSIPIDHRCFLQVSPAPVIMYLLSFPCLLYTSGIHLIPSKENSKIGFLRARTNSQPKTMVMGTMFVSVSQLLWKSWLCGQKIIEVLH